jgi:signal transduction histidine kinase
MDQFAQPAKDKKLTIKFIEPEKDLSILKINVDTDRFKQILVNLASNAIKYTNQGGLTVALSQPDTKNLAIKFKDTGVGMNAKQREKLFQKFYRVENSQINTVTGTGLGLWITKMITEAMRGEIMVDSIEGVGTEFTVTFPIAKS